MVVIDGSEWGEREKCGLRKENGLLLCLAGAWQLGLKAMNE